MAASRSGPRCIGSIFAVWMLDLMGRTCKFPTWQMQNMIKKNEFVYLSFGQLLLLPGNVYYRWKWSCISLYMCNNLVLIVLPSYDPFFGYNISKYQFNWKVWPYKIWCIKIILMNQSKHTRKWIRRVSKPLPITKVHYGEFSQSTAYVVCFKLDEKTLINEMVLKKQHWEGECPFELEEMVFIVINALDSDGKILRENHKPCKIGQCLTRIWRTYEKTWKISAKLAKLSFTPPIS